MTNYYFGLNLTTLHRQQAITTLREYETEELIPETQRGVDQAVAGTLELHTTTADNLKAELHT